MTDHNYGPPPDIAYEQSDDISELVKALVKFHGAMGPVARDKQVSVPNKYSFWYADLAAIQEATRTPLAENGLVVIQSPGKHANGVSVTTVVAHSSGQWVRGVTVIPVGGNTPQAVGSAITYGRRYGLSAMLGVAAEDDDGVKAAQPGRREKAESPRRRTNQPALLDGLARIGVTWQDVERWLGRPPTELTKDEADNLDEIGHLIAGGRPKEDFFPHPGADLEREFESEEGLF